ncbi:MAG: Ig-like domain-containing protein, partial [Armatimonadetes bacterium]|nr:Ig-like domain-containing protein [Armatimonadota bacterium]
DDGSALADGPGTNLGIRVIASGFTLPTVNQYVVVTGICSSFESGGVRYRQIRVRGAADVLATMGTNHLEITLVTSPDGLLDISSAQGNWWAAVGLAGVPINPNPESVFGGAMGYMPSGLLDENLSWFDPTGDQDAYPYPFVYYPDYRLVLVPTEEDPYHLERQKCPFGVVYSARGYWMRMASPGGTISYLGVMEPVQSTDRYISLPCDALTWIGNPFDHSVLYQSVLVTDGKTVLSFMDAWRNNWIYPYGYWWNCGNQSLYMVEGDLQWANLDTGICMRPWHGFWVCSNKDSLALIITGGDVKHETMTVTADPPYIAPAGTYEVTAKALLRSGYPLENAVVEFVTSAGALSAPDGQTDQNGEVKVTLSNVPAGQSPVVTATSAYACPGPIAGSCTIAIDTTPPSTPVVIDDGDFTTSTTTLHASWSASDPETGIAGYEYAIGTTQGGTDVVSWTPVSTGYVTRTGLSLTSGNTYFFAATEASTAQSLSA